ncbi:DNA mismatch repair protein MutS [Natronospora cellulosivora (SeqCode)]
MSNLTPMMQQYMEIKEQYADAILFFRMGDFYEMFFEDAEIAARVLDLALTARNKGGGEKAPMAGIPYHSADSYISKLINQGFKVAICEQLENPSEANGIVKRDVIRVITPGTVIETDILDENDNNYLASTIFYDNTYGFSYIDISTGEFYVTEIKKEIEEKLWDEIDRIQSKEIIVDEYINQKKIFTNIASNQGFLVNKARSYKVKEARDFLLDHFNMKSLTGFDLEDRPSAILAAAEILNFVNHTQKRSLKHIDKITNYSLHEYMVIDTASRRNLELSTTIREKKKNGSLLGVLDNTLSSMGGRLIKKWINQPLIKKNAIDARLNAVEELKDNYMLLQAVRNNIDGIYDLERILSKITYGTANARDLNALKVSLEKLPGLKENIHLLNERYFKELNNNFDILDDIYQLIMNSIMDEPPVTLREGSLIKEGYHEELDELRTITHDGRKWISKLQKSERERTDISSLKVAYNKVFGYYIEVTKANLDKVPENYTRKQTLANSERYITPELKDKEAMILGAEEKINDLEYDLFVEIREQVAQNVERIKKAALIVAKIDVIASLSLLAIENNYQKPEIHEGMSINIEKGRHPVVEAMLNDNFVPNDTLLNEEEQRFIIITGPNMSGKSTYMRQVALIVLMAQMGSFVPAESATIGLVDRIFTRVGASDDLSTGQSTFMVEMNEVANIINNATKRSLVILDEVGRGTSTYDGLSIAWAVSEYINDESKIGARSLFATHYHELTKLEEKHQGIKNYNVLVEEDDNGVHFLHKIIPGRTSDSYGIEVAKLAGLPLDLIENANNILKELEANNQNLDHNSEKIRNRSNIKEDYLDNVPVEEGEELEEQEDKVQEKVKQMKLFEEENIIIKELKETNLLNLTPMQAMNILYNLHEKAKKGDY